MMWNDMMDFELSFFYTLCNCTFYNIWLTLNSTYKTINDPMLLTLMSKFLSETEKKIVISTCTYKYV